MYNALADFSEIYTLFARSAFPVKIFDRSRSGFQQIVALEAGNDFHGPHGQALLLPPLDRPFFFLRECDAGYLRVQLLSLPSDSGMSD